MNAQAPAPKIRRLRTAIALFAFGLTGIAALYLALPPVTEFPRWAYVVNPTIMLAVFVVAGTFIAPVCGFRSRIAERVSGHAVSLLPPGAALFVLAGIAAGIVVGLADHGTRPLWQDPHGLTPALTDNWRLTSLRVGIFYGGVVEELTLRWGVMSLAVLVVWKAFGRNAPRPSVNQVWIGIAIAAILFALGHLPALASSGAELTQALVFRTLFWNATLGILFGTLFARHDLEAAMLAHAGFHVGLLPASLLAVLV
ncbi:type II CAAX prenyl endopeptidase Rce1 family protein [Aliihoeflea sp. 40Bstr573]|uniref:CPBP family glutamic-type intramembrane protease n=1 Tax=Aliihoeflea sp. 40Bstr573 TaxID=2696467 RepID=UPI0020950651|nr:CPBP family glutamic-type intramembrane protease [Aliihoeflea sp. 40Bstr573]MCO6388845.1 CPBP family intramembrane metalloprotease [Aliihoeflea sp. 40Bstr573]